MSIRVGIVGISGFGGGEAMRLVASHPSFELTYAAGEGSVGSRLVDRFPGVPAKLAELVIEKWDPVTLPKLDVLFASLPTGASAEALARVPKDVRIVDIGGDHRYVEGWAYGLADIWPAQIEGQIRVANPGCFPAATLNALAPLLANKLIEPGNIVIDAKTGISGAGRGGADSKLAHRQHPRGFLRQQPGQGPSPAAFHVGSMAYAGAGITIGAVSSRCNACSGSRHKAGAGFTPRRKFLKTPRESSTPSRVDHHAPSEL